MRARFWFAGSSGVFAAVVGAAMAHGCGHASSSVSLSCGDVQPVPLGNACKLDAECLASCEGADFTPSACVNGRCEAGQTTTCEAPLACAACGCAPGCNDSSECAPPFECSLSA